MLKNLFNKHQSCTQDEPGSDRSKWTPPGWALVHFSLRQVIKHGYLLASICGVRSLLNRVFPHMASRPRTDFLTPLRKWDEIKFFFLKKRELIIYILKKVNNGTFYKNKLDSLIIQGGEKIRKTKWNVRTQINCVDKFKEPSGVLLWSPWESRTEVRRTLHLLTAPRLVTEKRCDNQTTDESGLESTWKGNAWKTTRPKEKRRAHSLSIKKLMMKKLGDISISTRMTHFQHNRKYGPSF